MTGEVRDAIAQADRHHAWASQSLDIIRDRWADDTKNGALLDLRRETRIPAHQQHDFLELLRRAAADVGYLLKVIDTATDDPHPTRTRGDDTHE